MTEESVFIDPRKRRARVAVIGAGIMGANHVRIALQSTRMELVAVIDQDLERARALTHDREVFVSDDISQLAGLADLAVVAVPTASHLEVATAVAEMGIDMLIEKPLSGSSKDARKICDAAKKNRVILAVGHVERFNAAVAELHKFVERPIHIQAKRISPFSPRISDGVIFDLMIHDLDIILDLAGPDATVTHISGISRAIKGSSEDLASVTLRFDSGLTATVDTSRLGQQKQRSIEITQDDTVIVADLLRQDITIHRMARHEYLAEDGARYRTSSVVEIPFLETRGEPLANELDHIAMCCMTRSNPRVDGETAVRAIKLAEAIAVAVSR